MRRRVVVWRARHRTTRRRVVVWRARHRTTRRRVVVWRPPRRLLECHAVPSSPADRRRYPRIQAPVLWRAAGLRAFHHRRNVADVSLGGMRAFSDLPLRVGQRLDCEVLEPGASPIRVWGRVVWSEPAPGEPGTFESGIEFTDLDPSDLQRLSALLVRDGSGPAG